MILHSQIAGNRILIWFIDVFIILSSGYYVCCPAVCAADEDAHSHMCTKSVIHIYLKRPDGSVLLRFADDDDYPRQGWPYVWRWGSLVRTEVFRILSEYLCSTKRISKPINVMLYANKKQVTKIKRHIEHNFVWALCPALNKKYAYDHSNYPI